MIHKKTATVLASLALATAAHAAITLNVSTGSGWVGKGDVQLAYAWNDKTMQNNANSVNFEVFQQVSYTVTCEILKTTGRSPETLYVTNSRTRNLNDYPDADPRLTKSRFTGFFLNGYTGLATSSGDPAPVLGGSCTAQGITGTITELSSTVNQTKLFAVYNGDKRLLATY